MIISLSRVFLSSRTVKNSYSSLAWNASTGKTRTAKKVKLLETSEYGNTDLNAIISGDRNFNYEEKESFGEMGFSKQEFNEKEELVNVEDDQDDSQTDDFMDGFDDSILDEE